MNIDRNSVLSLLNEDSVVEVVFIKKNLEPRTMHCTRNLNILKNYFDEEYYNLAQPKGKEVIYSENNIKVYDMDKRNWRSFNLDTVVSIEAMKSYTPTKYDSEGIAWE